MKAIIVLTGLLLLGLIFNSSNARAEQIIVAGKLYLDSCLNTIRIVNDEDRHTNLIDLLRTMDHHQVTILVVSDRAGKISDSVNNSDH